MPGHLRLAGAGRPSQGDSREPPGPGTRAIASCQQPHAECLARPEWRGSIGPRGRSQAQDDGHKALYYGRFGLRCLRGHSHSARCNLPGPGTGASLGVPADMAALGHGPGGPPVGGTSRWLPSAASPSMLATADAVSSAAATAVLHGAACSCNMAACTGRVVAGKLRATRRYHARADARQSESAAGRPSR